MKIEIATKKDLKEIAKLMIEEFSKPPFNEKTNLKDVLKSLDFYLNIENIFIIRKTMRPPHTKVCGLFGARFLDARNSPHLKRCGFLKNFDIKEKDEIIGVLEFVTEQWWEGKVIIIKDLVIKNKYKGNGFGKLLMRKLEKYAKQKKIKSINFQTNKKAISVKFYEKLGYKIKKNTIFMRKEIR